ncbi:MAG: stage II sporulation protein M [Bacteroidota bacterium]
MTETQFIEVNKEQWEELENLLDQRQKDPDRLHELFVKVSSDLAYASTFYPKRSVRAYLNQLTQRVFDSMEKKKTTWSIQPVKEFFKNVLPAEMYASRKALLTSFIVFTIAVLIGVISTAHDSNFPRIILGDEYVDMTEQNIDNDDPMAVYKQSEQSDMFFGITTNNIKVSFFCFILGIFGSLGTIIILFHNGIMLGAFQYYFHTKGLFLESFLTIWIHGAIEISAIIIAGTAGIVLGNGLLFPATYDRGTSMQVAARRSVRIIIGTVPLFIIAGFLESFVTRLTDMPTLLKVAIIGLSFLFIIGLYVIYPWWHHQSRSKDNDSLEIKPNETRPLKFEKLKFRDMGESIYLGFAQFRVYMGRYFAHAVGLLVLTTISVLTLYQWLLSPIQDYDFRNTLLASMEFGGFSLFFLYWIISTYALLILVMIYREEPLNLMNKMIHLKLHFINMMLVTLIPIATFYFGSFALLIILFLVMPPSFLAYVLYMIPEKGWSIWSELNSYYSLSFSHWGKTFLTFIFIICFHGLIVLSLLGAVGSLFIDFISWHDLFSGRYVTHIVFMTTAFTFIYLFILPLYFYLFVNQMNSEKARKNATDLWNRFRSFNTHSTLFESTK